LREAFERGREVLLKARVVPVARCFRRERRERLLGG